MHTLVVVILILLFTTDELTLFHTMCVGGQSIRRKMYESNGEEEGGEVDEEKLTGRT